MACAAQVESEQLKRESRFSKTEHVTHCSCVTVTMVGPRFSLRRPGRRDLSPASSRKNSAGARPLPASWPEHSRRTSEGMGSSTEAPKLRQRYRCNRHFAVFLDIGGACNINKMAKGSVMDLSVVLLFLSRGQLQGPDVMGFPTDRPTD